MARWNRRFTDDYYRRHPGRSPAHMNVENFEEKNGWKVPQIRDGIYPEQCAEARLSLQEKINAYYARVFVSRVHYNLDDADRKHLRDGFARADVGLSDSNIDEMLTSTPDSVRYERAGESTAVYVRYYPAEKK